MDRADLPDLMAFSVIAEEGSFRRAAAKLGVSPSALSHSMRRLEVKYGTGLLLRTTRSVAPTDPGLELLQRLKPALDEIDRGLLQLAGRSGRVAGLVRINVHRDAADLLILPKLRDLQRDYPEIRVELLLDDGIADIVAAGCDAGVRNGERLAKDMIAVRLSGEHHSAVVAAPSYFEEERSPLEVPEDLHLHRCIAYRHVTSRVIQRWLFTQGDRALELAIDPCLIVDDPNIAARAALRGVGLCYIFRESIADHLRSGALVEVLRDWSVPFAGDFLYYPSRRTLSAAMRVVIDRLRP